MNIDICSIIINFSFLSFISYMDSSLNKILYFYFFPETESCNSDFRRRHEAPAEW